MELVEALSYPKIVFKKVLLPTFGFPKIAKNVLIMPDL